MSSEGGKVGGGEILVRLCGVGKTFDGGDGRAVLEDLDLTLLTGESVAIVGPSGSGKSTLLNIVGSLEPPSSGEVQWRGSSLAGRSPNEIATLRNSELGFVFQHHLLLPQCSALENVLLPTLANKVSAGEAQANRARAQALLERVGLGHRLGHRPAALSGGERQRVAVVRALINSPQLLLADEPTGSLDEESAQGLGDLFVELNREEGLALLVVTHSMALAERMGRLLELRGGSLHTKQVAGA
ncbi:MAG: lipoprotein-releasing system ATP-binding protein [Planctomycetota bacterium]|jgi:lipoprotein-releasing system ATP-binding protein